MDDKKEDLSGFKKDFGSFIAWELGLSRLLRIDREKFLSKKQLNLLYKIGVIHKLNESTFAINFEYVINKDIFSNDMFAIYSMVFILLNV